MLRIIAPPEADKGIAGWSVSEVPLAVMSAEGPEKRWES
jgi:hypothetical protein